METSTLTALLTQVRQLADVEAFTARYPDATIATWINQGIVAYRELVGGRASRVLRSHVTKTLSAASGTRMNSSATWPAFALVDADCCSTTACDPEGTGGVEQVIDGVLVVEGTRVLCTGESVTPTKNGVWIAHPAAWTRAPEFAIGMDPTTIVLRVRGGLVRAETWWADLGDLENPKVIGSSSLTIAEYDSPPSRGVSYLSLSGFDYTRIRSVFAREDDGETWYQIHEAVSDRELGTHEASETGRPDRWWVDGASGLMHLAPPTDRERAVRIVYESSAAALATGTDTFQSLIHRGVEYVATFAAMKLLARDGSQEHYALLAAELARCEMSIRNAVRDFTGGTRRRRDTRSERERDQGLSSLWVWPDR